MPKGFTGFPIEKKRLLHLRIHVTAAFLDMKNLQKARSLGLINTNNILSKKILRS